MSSFPENNVAAAATEIQESLAHNPMQSAYGGGPDNGASDVHGTTVYQPEGVVFTNPTEVMNEQNIGNGENDVYVQAEAVVSAPALEVVSEVMDATAVVPAQGSSEEGAQVAVEELVAPEEVDVSVVDDEVNVRVVENDQNNVDSISNDEEVNKEVVATSQIIPPLVMMNDQNNGNDNNTVLDDGVVVMDENNSNGNNEVVVPGVDSILNSNGSNEVVTPSVVNYQNNGIGNNAVAINSGVGEAIKRKRGRPRKYPIGDASAVPAVSSPSMAMQSDGQVPVNAQVQGSFEKRGRGRPAGSGKKQKADGPSPFTVSLANSGSTGAGFLPYVITVKSGEYVQPTLLSLSQYDKQVVCVLSASGTISNVTLQPTSSSGGTVTCQGCFEILSLSGSFLQSGSGAQRSITGGLSVSLAQPDGSVFGGGVAGPLIAASDVQIIVGTFLASEQNLTRSVCNNVITPPLNQVPSVGGSPPSRALLSESSSGALRSPFNNYSNWGYNNGNQQPVPNVTWT
ncbi:hypothetical protein POM88_035999 [Heracleum sosnowskyi]|uniref:AT-hook motif nuclear-localized protein n=1 Tax=Heracleum sosnowskyi TaxID=360622 RepID=A0AAD8HMC0_9APIA|nr:hypothetical protein POM88_035999 [Heracleum sosnowskyi]